MVTWFDAHWDAVRRVPDAATARHRRGAPGGLERSGGGNTTRAVSTAAFIPTARGRVKHGDLNAAGQFALGAIVHRFSNASGQLGAAIGMDARFMQQQRRGFSTFELVLQMSGALPLDAPYLVETGIGHLGSSSLRMVHRMTHARTGAEIARLSQFGVNLDLDARRPARWPDDIRDRAAALVVPTG